VALRALLDAGFDHKDAAYAGFLLNDYVTAFVLEETQYANAEDESPSQDTTSGVQNWLEGLPESEYPSVVTLADYLVDADVDERFQFGIEILRAGLEARLARQKARDETV
jgi:TetR/AcrR family transcriptional regulator, tetracycline repressor protein